MSKPVKRFKCGSIVASIGAECMIADGEKVKFYSIKVDKAYKDVDTQKHTNLFATKDLPKVVLVVNEAYRYILLQE